MKKVLTVLLAAALLFALVPASALAAGETKTINNSADLAAAIAAQDDNQTWNLAANTTFDLTGALIDTYKAVSINSATNFIFPIKANGLTINGGPGTVITSSYIVPDPDGGLWHWQNFITIGGNSVTLNGLTLIPNVNHTYDPSGINKIIEILGTGSTLKNIVTQPNGSADFSGSIYYNNSVSTDTLENVTLNKGRISFSGKTGGTQNMTNVTIDFLGALASEPDLTGLWIPGGGIEFSIENVVLLMSQPRIDRYIQSEMGPEGITIRTEPLPKPEPEPELVSSYTVSYHPNGGTGTVPMDMNRYYKGDKVTLASGAALSRPGYVFLGWALGNGTAVTSPYTMGYSDVTFFAVWGTAQDLPEVPKTGDNASAFGFVMLFAGLAAAAFVLIKKRAASK